ncbi:MAG: PEP-CTERM sorting domain-containing protein [Planctomycetota bacterium]
MRPLLILPSLVTAALISTDYAVADTLTFLDFNGGNDLIVVEADPFDVNGVAGNTVFADPGNTGGTTTTSQATFQDASTWKYRDSNNWGGVPNDFTGVYSSFGNGAADNSELDVTTSVSGLDLNTYNVFVVFLSDSTLTNGAGIAAALSGDPLVDYLFTSETANGQIKVGESDSGGTGVFQAYAIQVGTVTGTEISIDAGLTNQVDSGSGDERSVYIGLGYQVVPEPGSLALLGLGGLCVLRRRRN